MIKIKLRHKRHWPDSRVYKTGDMFVKPEKKTAEETVVVIRRLRCKKNVYHRLSHDVGTWDEDRDVPTAYC